MVVGDYAYVSYYKEGAIVLDVSDPTQPTEVASFVTYDNPSNCPDGVGFCSAIAQWFEDGRFYLLDMENGLWILNVDQPHGAQPALIMKAVKTGANQDVYLKWNHTGESQYTVRRNGSKELVRGTPTVDVDARLSYVDKGAVAGSNIYFYHLNGPWQ